MTRGKKSLLLVLLLAGILGGCLLIYMCEPPAGVTSENYDRLRHGMTIRQASAILGGPPSDVVVPGDKWAGKPLPADIPCYVWKGDGVRILLAFNADGTIRQGSKEFRDGNTGSLRWQMGLPQRETMVSRVRRWMHW